jgi:PAS domain S-box-containing protein
MVESHDEAFPGIPIIFCGSTEEMLGGLKLDSDFTGTWGVAQPEKTLIAALRLLPSTKHLVVVGGVGTYDRDLESFAKKSFRGYESKLDITYLTDLDMPALLERLKHLRANTIVYHTAITQDAAGTRFIDATQSVPMIAGAANAPVFVVDDVDVGRGSTGGYVLSLAAEGRTAAEMAVRVLNGEKPANIPVVKSPNIYMFDWRAMQRFGLKESNLPPGSMVLYRQPTIWKTYQRYILGVIFLILLETLLIVGLLWQRARRRKVEESLKKSEEKFSTAFRESPMALTLTSVKDHHYLDVNETFERLTGWRRDEVIGRTPFDINVWDAPTERLQITKRLLSEGAIRNYEFQLRCRDGTTKWGLGSAELIEIENEPCML